MKKTLIALAVLGATAGVAHAQSNVTIYGIVDTGFVKQSGSKIVMDEKVNNRLGFRGVEDLGGGLKATFELEKRFDLFNGATRGEAVGNDGLGSEFDGASNVGLASRWGAVRFGRVNELATESYRTLDPFNQYGVAGMFETPLRSARISSTTRYDSPNFSGFSFGGSYTLKNQNDGVNDGELNSISNDGWGVSGKYANGPLVVVANYNKAVNTGGSYNWNVGGAYAFGPLKVSLGYEDTTVKNAAVGDGGVGDEQTVLVGLSYKLGAGTVNGSYNYRKSEYDAFPGDQKDHKYALGYTHDVSKRTSVYLDLSYTDLDSGSPYFGGDDSIEAIQIGITHKF